MRGRVAVLANGLIPGSAAPSSAHGLRATGLYTGLTGAGIACDIVSASSAITAQLDRWGTGRMRIPAHWRILQDQSLSYRLNADYRAVIVPNWPAAKGFRKGDKVKLIYDFFSATLIEHALIADEAEVERRKSEKIALLSQADIVTANGRVQSKYGKAFCEEEVGLKLTGDVPAIRLALPWHDPQLAPGPMRIFVGGFLQAWTTGITLQGLEALADTADLEIHTMGFGQHAHFRGMSRSARASRSHERLIAHEVASFQSYRDLNTACHLALDVFEPNEERRMSYSTRAISSIACGCPVITMAFTEVGRLIERTGAGWTLSEFSMEELSALISRLRDNPDEVAAARAATRTFWEAHIDPRKQIGPLVRMLRSGETNVG
ncbi:MAG: glycosyltransferase [Pseudomonadota bacterium]